MYVTYTNIHHRCFSPKISIYFSFVFASCTVAIISVIVVSIMSKTLSLFLCNLCVSHRDPHTHIHYIHMKIWKRERENKMFFTSTTLLPLNYYFYWYHMRVEEHCTGSGYMESVEDIRHNNMQKRWKCAAAKNSVRSPRTQSFIWMSDWTSERILQ